MKKKGRKTRRQQLAEKRATAKERVETANSLSDPLDESLRSYRAPDDSRIDVRCSRVGDLPRETVVWIFDLMEKNMKKMYEQTGWGWNPKDKEKELTEPAAWYLIASDSDDRLIGFSHFRFDLDYGVEVLYCYELQIEPTARRNGLGRFMMTALESMALENLMQKVVLTVFKRNFTAVPFFNALGYTFPFVRIWNSFNATSTVLSLLCYCYVFIVLLLRLFFSSSVLFARNARLSPN